MKRTFTAKAVMILSLSVAAALWSSGPRAWAEETVPATGASPVVSGETVLIPVGGSSVVKLPFGADRVTASDAKIVRIQTLTPQEILVEGLALGSTEIIARSPDNLKVWRARVEVQIDREALKAELLRLFPRAKLEFRQLGNNVVITGLLSKAEESDQLHRYMDAAGLKFVDLTSLPGVPQVQLKVTVAEANRTAMRALGFNAVLGGRSAFGGVNIGSNPISSFNPVAPIGTQAPVPLSIPTAATIFGGVPSADLTVFIEALSENQYVRVLAEPTLTALSGQEASFLAGGEVPIPVPQSGGGIGAAATITIEFKEFGVRLRFKPTVQGDGMIRLHVAPEVSDLDFTNGLTISGTTVPAFRTRRSETTLELGSGQTFAMAGLLNKSVSADNSRVPGLGDVPVLGALFRSVRYKAQDTEMLVLVTASLVEPQSGAGPYPVPGITHVAPNDWELYSLGAIEGTSPVARPPMVIGPAGASLSRLKGPGAATYDPPTTMRNTRETAIEENK